MSTGSPGITPTSSRSGKSRTDRATRSERITGPGRLAPDRVRCWTRRFLLACALTQGLASASTLPVRIFTSADGLPSERVRAIFRDSRDFLWIGTPEGVARFDSQRFVTYGREDGLPGLDVSDIAESADGTLWLATRGGVARLPPPPAGTRVGAKAFVAVPRAGGGFYSGFSLCPSASGRLFAGTDRGLFELRGDVLVEVPLPMPHDSFDDRFVLALAESRNGILWIGTGTGFYFLEESNGRSGRLGDVPGRPGSFRQGVEALLCDHAGRLWIGGPDGLSRIDRPPVPPPDGSLPAESLRLLAAGRVAGLSERAGGEVLANFFSRIDAYDGDEGLRTIPASSLVETVDEEISCVAEDPAGNLWIGTHHSGVARLESVGFIRYGASDGLEGGRVVSTYLSRDGAVCAELASRDHDSIACLRGGRFDVVRPKLPGDVVAPGWGLTQLAFEDANGRTWLPTGQGLFLYPPVPRPEDLARTLPERAFRKSTGLPVDNVYRLFSTRGGEVWFSTAAPAVNLIVRAGPDTDSLEILTAEECPARGKLLATAFGEDRAGDLWVGSNGAGLFRRRPGGRLEPVFSWEDLLQSDVTSLFADREGRLWAGTEQSGAFRIEDPEAARPRITSMKDRADFSSDGIFDITEDRAGNMYFVTRKGIDRMASGGTGIEHFTAADGLPAGGLTAVLCDRAGNVWVGGGSEIARLEEGPSGTPPLPRILIESLEVADVAVPVSPLGASRIARLRLGASQNSLKIALAALSWNSRRSVAFQYRLDPKRPWSTASTDRSVTLASLSSGSYRFEARAIDSSGRTSLGSASIEFTVAPPFWRRGSVIALAALALLSALLAFHRLRTQRLLGLERIRTQIAGDLHDDIGAGLSEVAVLAEVVRQRVGSEDPRSADLVGEVAQTARDLVESMGEIVWAIDPRRDDLAGLLARLRHFGATLAETRGIRFQMNAPGDLGSVSLAPAPRRDLYLLLKEAIHNAIRHSGGGAVTVTIDWSRGTLRAEVIDDGRGFDPAAPRDGHGLDSMGQRARALGGAFELSSAPGGGTRVTIRVPVGRPA